MAASEVAVSLAIVRLHDLLSMSKDINTTDQISDSINKFQWILNTMKQAEVNDDHNQETMEGKERLLHSAREAKKIAEEYLDKLFQHQMSKLQKGRLTKVFDVVRFFSVMNRGSARKNMAKDFVTKVRSLFSDFTSSRPPAKGLPENERASSSSSSERILENTRQRVESDIVGRDQEVKHLLNWLMNDDSNLRVISVVSKQVCGKTTLVRSVFSKLKIKHHFDCRAWVSVTDLGAELDPMKNLLVDILKQTPLRDQVKDLEHKQEEQLFEMLHKSLMGLRYLIVLDNLRKASLIRELLVPFVDSMNGSRVIVTTPCAKMQKFADPWTRDLQLTPAMTNEECKKLLRVSIMGDDYSESETTNLEQSILSKCNRSPPAISLLGGLLSAVKDSNQVALIDRLGQCPTLDKVMDLSFEQLPYMMKLCVYYMALFPKESEVPTRRLFRLWAAEGLLAEAADGLLAEAADGSVQVRSAEDYFCKLESRNLIRVVRRKLDGSARSCRMPAFIHDFLRPKKEESLHLPIHSSVFDAEQSGQNQQNQAQNTATGQCLRSFVLFNTRKLGTKVKIAVLLKSLKVAPLCLLRVLDLEGVYKPVLPENFGNTLSNLRYLGLRWTVLDFIPDSVGNLLFLETLDLKHTNITKVTSSIWNVKNLRHLYLSEASFDKFNQHQISSGKSPNTKLETLWGLFIETANSPMIRVLESLGSLKKLGVTCPQGVVKRVTDCVLKLHNLASLRLRSRDLYGQPLQALRLRSRDLFSQNVSLPLSDMKEAPSLINLYLLGSLRPDRSESVLPKRPELPSVLPKPPELSSVLPKRPELPSVLPKPPELSSVLPKKLKALTLSMSELEEDPMRVLGRLEDLIILRLLARSYTNIALSCDKKSFPKLRVLKLWMLENLEILEVKKDGMAKLEELEIRQCLRLTSVSGLHNINSLKSVTLSGFDVGHAVHVGVPHDTLVKPKELFLSSFWKPT